jgi:hypothetical protein
MQSAHDVLETSLSRNAVMMTTMIRVAMLMIRIIILIIVIPLIQIKVDIEK